jgi:hypothetical protein
MAFPHVSLNHGDPANELRHAIQRVCQKKWMGKEKLITLRPQSINDQGESSHSFSLYRLSCTLKDADFETYHPPLADLSDSLSSFSEENPNNLIIVTAASRPLRMTKRASADESADDNYDGVMDPSLGLLHRYQVSCSVREQSTTSKIATFTYCPYPLLSPVLLHWSPHCYPSHGSASDSCRLHCHQSRGWHRDTRSNGSQSTFRRRQEGTVVIKSSY